MTERYIKIPNEKLSTPTDCLSPDVIAIAYLLPPKIGIEDTKQVEIIAIKCRNVKCPLADCQYKNIVPFKK